MKSSPHFRPALALVATAMALLSLGCTTTDEFEFAIDAISHQPLPTGRAASFRIQNCNPAITEDSLRFQEAAGHIKTALSGRGLWEAPDLASAALIVELEYGIEAPHLIRREVDVPIFGEVRDVSGQNVTLHPPGEGESSLGGDDSQLVAYGSQSEEIMVSEKHLMVTCRQNRVPTAGEPPVTLWRVSASIENPSRDLRDCLPVLATAIMKKIGTATDGVTLESLPSTDPSIVFIRRGLE